MQSLGTGIASTRRDPQQLPADELTTQQRAALDHELAQKIVKICEGDLKLMNRRLEEIKDGKEPSNLMMSEEMLTLLANIKVDKVKKISIGQREK